MAIHYYHLKVINCRTSGETGATVTSSNKAALKQQTRNNGKPAWDFTFASTDVAEPVASQQFMDAFNAAQCTAPNNVSYTCVLNEGVAGSLDLALTASSLSSTFGTASSGPWSQRVGKQLFRYEIGYSTTSLAAATAAIVAHNLA